MAFQVGIQSNHLLSAVRCGNGRMDYTEKKRTMSNIQFVSVDWGQQTGDCLRENSPRYGEIQER